MRGGYFAVMLIYLIVAGAELRFHWYMGHGNTSASNGWRGWYLQKDPRNGMRYREGVVDFVVPTIVLGVAAGCVARKWTSGESIACMVLLTISIVALWGIYDIASLNDRPTWVGASLETRIKLIVFGPPRVIMLLAICFLSTRALCLQCEDANRMAGRRKSEVCAERNSTGSSSLQERGAENAGLAMSPTDSPDAEKETGADKT